MLTKSKFQIKATQHPLFYLDTKTLNFGFLSLNIQFTFPTCIGTHVRTHRFEIKTMGSKLVKLQTGRDINVIRLCWACCYDFLFIESHKAIIYSIRELL